MSPSVDSVELYEYAPMNVSYSNLGFGYKLAVGLNTSGGLRGHVVIHEYSPNQVQVSVFSDTAVRRLAPNSWRQATVKLVKGGQVLVTEVVKKHEPYIISEHSKEFYLGSARLDLPPPVDPTPIQVSITVTSIGIFPEGSVPGKTQHAEITISVRKKAMP